jgi:hypothetical protein
MPENNGKIKNVTLYYFFWGERLGWGFRGQTGRGAGSLTAQRTQRIRLALPGGEGGGGPTTIIYDAPPPPVIKGVPIRM